MLKLLFFCFRVSNSRLKNKISLLVTNSLGALLFSHFSYELEVDKSKKFIK